MSRICSARKPVYRRSSARIPRFVGAALLSLFLLPGCGRAQEEDWQTMNSSRRSAGEQSLSVDVEYGAGRLVLGPGNSGTLYSTSVRYDANAFTPVVEYGDNRLKLGVSGSTRRARHVRTGELNLQLAPDVPLELALKFGAAEANLELGGLRVQRLQVQTGASRTSLSVSTPNPLDCQFAELQLGAAQFEATGLGNLNAANMSVKGGVGEIVLDFTGEWSADMNAKIEMGLGSLTLRMPQGLGVRVVRSGVLSAFDGQGLVKRGDSYFSEGWDSSTRKLSVDLSAALGSVRVVWVDS
jgi:hypothetical protein